MSDNTKLAVVALVALVIGTAYGASIPVVNTVASKLPRMG